MRRINLGASLLPCAVGGVMGNRIHADQNSMTDVFILNDSKPKLKHTDHCCNGPAVTMICVQIHPPTPTPAHIHSIVGLLKSLTANLGGKSSPTPHMHEILKQIPTRPTKPV